MAKSRFVEYCEYLPAKAIMVTLRLIPYRLALACGAGFGRFVRLILPGQRRIVRENFRIAFGDTLSPREARRLEKRVFVELGKTIFEFMQFPKLTREKLLRRVRFVNLEAMDRALALGKGVIGISAHYGNWEMLAAGFAASGRPLAAIVRPLDNKLLDAYVERFRTEKGVQVVPRGLALREGIRALRRGAVLAFMSDQNSAMHGVFVPFFGRLAATVQGPAILAAHLGCPVMLCTDRREPDGSHTLTFHEPIPFEQGTDEADTVLKNTANYTAAIERAVRERPEQWLWLHPRWRTRPPGESS